MRILLASLLLVLVACGDVVNPPAGGDPGGDNIGMVTIAAPRTFLMPGDTIQLHATVRTATGAVLPDAVVTWEADPSLVRVLTGGRVVAPGVHYQWTYGGAVTVTARAGNATDSTTVHVCGSRPVWVQNRVAVNLQIGRIGEGWMIDSRTQFLFGAGIWHGSTPQDVIIGGSPRGTIFHVDGTSPTCFAAIEGGQFARTLWLPRVDIAQTSSVRLQQEVFSPDLPLADRTLLFRYTFTNTSDRHVSGFRIGGYFDWDLAFNEFSGNDYAYYDTALHAHVAYESTGERAGIASIDAPFTYARQIAGRVGFTLVTPADHLADLSRGISTGPVGPGDVISLFGFGPFDLAPGETKSVMFLMTVGKNAEEFAQNVAVGRGLAAHFPNP